MPLLIFLFTHPNTGMRSLSVDEGTDQGFYQLLFSGIPYAWASGGFPHFRQGSTQLASLLFRAPFYNTQV